MTLKERAEGARLPYVLCAYNVTCSLTYEVLPFSTDWEKLFNPLEPTSPLERLVG